jgi:hypothetical protein
MTISMTRRHVVLAASLILAASGCTPDFEEIWQVKDLRILAIQADPPEVLAASLALVVPKVTLTALVVDPNAPNRVASWELWACPAAATSGGQGSGSMGFTCEDATTRQLIARKKSRLDQITAELTPTPQLLTAALQEDPGRGFGGVPLLVELRIEDDKQGQVQAIKRVVYGLALPLSIEALTQGKGIKLPPAKDGAWAGVCRSAAPACDKGLECLQSRCLKRPNGNPAVSDVSVDKQAVGSGWSVAAEAELELLPAPATGDKEPYVVQTFSGGTKQLEEYLTWNFYTTSGVLSHANTGGKPSPLVDKKKVDDITSTWTPADLSKQSSKQATLWIVVHDDRGGVGWTSLTAQVTPPKK